MTLSKSIVCLALVACGETRAVPDGATDDAAGAYGSPDAPPAADLAVDRATSFGSTQDDAARVVRFAPDGSSLVLGQFVGTVSIGSTSLTSGAAGTARSLLVARFDAAGAPISAFTFGGAAMLNGRALVRDGSNNIYVGGSFSGIIDFGGGVTRISNGAAVDAFVAKFTPAGAVMWVDTFGDANADDVRDLALAPDNSIAMVGRFAGTITLGTTQLVSAGGSFDLVLAKLAATTGSPLWVRQDGSAEASDIANTIAADGLGNLVVAGQYSATTTIANTALAGAGAADAFVAVYGPDGTARWAVRLAGAGADNASSLAVRPNQQIVAAGSFTGSATLPNNSTLAGAGGVDAFVLNLSPTGVLMSSVAIGGPDNEAGAAIALAGNGDVVAAFAVGISGATIAGRALGGAGGLDLGLVAITLAGDPRWARSFGGAADDTPNAIAARDTHVIVAGTSASPTLPIGPTSLTGAGGTDGFVVALDAATLDR